MNLHQIATRIATIPVDDPSTNPIIYIIRINDEEWITTDFNENVMQNLERIPHKVHNLSQILDLLKKNPVDVSLVMDNDWEVLWKKGANITSELLQFMEIFDSTEINLI